MSILLLAATELSLPVWLAPFIIVAFLSVGLIPLYLDWRKGKARAASYLSVPGDGPHLTYLLEPGAEVSPTRIRMAINLAYDALRTHGPWSPADLSRSFEGVRLDIQASPTWLDSAGQKVGGQDVGSLILVGPSLDALCHELAHVCELVVDRKQDVEQLPGSGKHPTWEKRGLDAADMTYRKMLGPA